MGVGTTQPSNGAKWNESYSTGTSFSLQQTISKSKKSPTENRAQPTAHLAESVKLFRGFNQCNPLDHIHIPL